MELAQYRELASFSQFGSDVDADTKKRLDHGLILMEILKQPQYQPIPVADQVMIIYAAINDYLVDIEVEHIKAFEKEFREFMSTQHPQIAKAIMETGKLDEETELQLKAGIETCKKIFSKRFA